MVVKAANQRIQERYFPNWEGEAPAEPQKSHNGIKDTNPQIAYDRCQDGECWVGRAYKTCLGGNPLHAYRASPGDRHMAHRLGRSLALPIYGFVRA